MVLKKLLFVIGAGLLLSVNSAFVQPQLHEQEYSLKAAFLYRFIDYIDWEKADNPGILNILIAGESDITAPLIEIFKNNKIRDKKVNVKSFSAGGTPGACQVIFVSRSCKTPLEAIVSKTESRSALVITEREEDFQKGSHINFLISDNKLKFEVNLKLASRSGIKISSQLLQHASIVKK